MLSFGMGIGLNKFRKSKQESIPFASDTLFYLDGTIKLVGATYYFEDKKNGKDFLITNYDFNDDWDEGFPYKSAATISAPAGDAALIAADINNYLYAADGTPNQIPVVSLFQDVDYEHKLFCKHTAQVVDDNGVETYEPRVSEIVLYGNVKTSADLTTCQTYYGVPTEDLTAKWVSVTGNDTTGNGSKATPWATITKALAVSTPKVYVRTGTTTEATFIRPNGKNIEVIGTGFTRIDANDVNYTMHYDDNQANTVSFTGCVIVGSFSCLYIETNSTNKSFIKCSFENSSSRDIWNGANVGLLLRYCVCKSLILVMNGLTFDTCLHTTKTGNNVIAASSAGANNILIKNSKILGGINTGTGSGKTDIFGCSIETTTLLNSGDLMVNDNYITGTLSVSNAQESVINNNTIITNAKSCIAVSVASTISNNIIKQTNIADHTIKINRVSADVFNNIIESTGDEPCGDVQSSSSLVSVTQNIYNNVIKHRGIKGYIIAIGEEGTTDVDYANIANIYNNTCYGAWYFNNEIVMSSLDLHGIFVGHCPNYLVKYNKVIGTAAGIVLKASGGDYSNGITMYNIFDTNNINMMVKGAEGAKLYNNLCLAQTAIIRHITFIDNADGVGAINGVVKNNIIYDENIANISAIFWDPASKTIANLSDINYNLYYLPNSASKIINHADYATYELWLAAGYDADTLITDPLLTDYIPQTGSPSIGAGGTLDAAYDDGLDASTNWGNATTVPAVVTKQQGISWDIGAYIS